MKPLRASNRGISTLADSVSEISESIIVSNGDSFPPDGPFTVSIDNEIILVGKRESNTFTDLERGYDGTSAEAHSAGAEVANRITAVYLNRLADIVKDVSGIGESGGTIGGSMVVDGEIRANGSLNVTGETLVAHNDEAPVDEEDEDKVNDDFGGVYIPEQIENSPWDGIINRGGPDGSMAARWKFNNETYLFQNDVAFKVINQAKLIAEVDSRGHLTKKSSFCEIEHPIHGSEVIRLGTTSAPRYEVVFRGKVTMDGETKTVNIGSSSHLAAGTFEELVQNAEVTSLQNKNGFTRVKAGDISGAEFTITAEESCSDDIVWVVMGERKDDHVDKLGHTDSAGRLAADSTL